MGQCAYIVSLVTKQFTFINSINVCSFAFSCDSPVIQFTFVNQCIKEVEYFSIDRSIFFPSTFNINLRFRCYANSASTYWESDCGQSSFTVFEETLRNLSCIWRSIVIGDFTLQKLSVLPDSFILNTIIPNKFTLSTELMLGKVSFVHSTIRED